jgi:membrane protein YdbS with pleckstrin-like domain
LSLEKFDREHAMFAADTALSLRPVFIGWITLLMQLPLQLFFAIWAGVFFGGMLTSFGRVPVNTETLSVAIGAIVFVAFPVVVYTVKKLNYARTEYRFYPDRLEFDEGFFTINRKVIKFHDVKEVTLRKGILQRIYGLGSIYLATLATGSTRSANPFAAFGFGNVSASGVSVRDIPNPDDAFDKIKSMVDARND